MLDITGESTPGVSGWFEVQVGDKLVHSKKNGEGHVDTGTKENKIKEAIKSQMGK